MNSWQKKQKQLIDDGYCVCEQVLDEAMLTQVREVSNRLLY